jgi:hypothetical protein
LFKARSQVLKDFNKISLWMIAIVATSENWEKKRKKCRLEIVFSKKQVLKLCKKLEAEWMRRAAWFFGCGVGSLSIA